MAQKAVNRSRHWWAPQWTIPILLSATEAQASWSSELEAEKDKYDRRNDVSVNEERDQIV